MYELKTSKKSHVRLHVHAIENAGLEEPEHCLRLHHSCTKVKECGMNPFASATPCPFTLPIHSLISGKTSHYITLPARSKSRKNNKLPANPHVQAQWENAGDEFSNSKAHIPTSVVEQHSITNKKFQEIVHEHLQNYNDSSLSHCSQQN